MAYQSPKWTQMTAPSGATSVSALTAAGDLFSKAMESAQTGLSNYDKGVESRLQDDIDVNTADVRRRIEDTTNLTEYGQIKNSVTGVGLDGYGKRIDRDLLRSSYDAQREQALAGTMDRVNTETRTGYGDFLQGNVNAFEQARASLPAELQGSVRIENGNLLGTETLSPEQQGMFAEAARAGGYQVPATFAEQKENFLTNILGGAGGQMTETEKQAAIASHKSVISTFSEIDEALRPAYEQANKNIDEDYQMDLQSLEENYNSTSQILGISPAMVAATVDNTTVDQYINEQYESGTWEPGIDAGRTLKGIIRDIGKDANLSDAELIFLIQRNHEQGVLWFDNGVDTDQLRKDAANNDFLKEGLAKVGRATALRKEYVKGKKSLRNNRDGQLSDATAKVRNASGIQSTSSNKAIIDRLTAGGKQAEADALAASQAAALASKKGTGTGVVPSTATTTPLPSAAVISVANAKTLIAPNSTGSVSKADAQAVSTAQGGVQTAMTPQAAAYAQETLDKVLKRAQTATAKTVAREEDLAKVMPADGRLVDLVLSQMEPGDTEPHKATIKRLIKSTHNIPDEFVDDVYRQALQAWGASNK